MKVGVLEMKKTLLSFLMAAACGTDPAPAPPAPPPPSNTLYQCHTLAMCDGETATSDAPVCTTPAQLADRITTAVNACANQLRPVCASFNCQINCNPVGTCRDWDCPEAQLEIDTSGATLQLR